MPCSLSPFAAASVVTVRQQHDFHEQIRLLVSSIAEPLQRLQLLLQLSGGGGIRLVGLVDKSDLPGKYRCLPSAAVVGLHDPAIDPMGGIEVPAPAS